MRAVAVTSKFQTFNYLRMTLASIAFAIALLFCLQVHADDSEVALRSEFNKTYAQLLHNPSDVDLTLKYADMAVRLNDYEAAIPPLERLVMLDPTLYRTRLKLGTFYAKLVSKVVARNYFEEVAREASAPQEVVTQAKLNLQKL